MKLTRENRGTRIKICPNATLSKTRFTQHINTLWERCRILNVKCVDTYTYHSVLKDDACMMRIMFKAL